jgi:tyrocidine synthetase-3
MMRIEQGYSTKSMAEASRKTREKEYWLNKLSGELEKSVFPGYHKKKTKDRRHQETNRDYKKLPFQLTGDIFSQLMKISNRSDLRLYIVLIAGVMGLLHKYTGNRDIIIGAPVDRQDIETQFINTVLILRNVVGGAMTFKELLLQVSKELREAAENVNYPLETLLYQLNIPYSPGDDFPLFETAVLLKNIHEKSYLDHIHLNIIFSFEKKDNLIEGELEYNDVLYGSETAAAIISHYTKLLTGALRNPGIYFSRLTLLPEEERRQLLVEFNDTTIDFPFEKTLPQLFAEQVEKSPRQMAAVCEEGQGQSTYEELNRQANRLAVRLREKGVKPDTIVGLMTGRTIEMVIGIMGILKAGGAYLPINPEHPAARIAYMLQDSSAQALVVNDTSCSSWLSFGPKALLNLYEGHHLNFPTSQLPSFPASLPSNLAYIIYTSGSTGRPKAVSLEHRNVVNLVFGLHERIYKCYHRGLRVALVAPYVFDASVQQIFATLLLGHTLYIVPENTRVDGNALLEFFKNYSIHITDGTPLHLGLMLESLAGSKVDLDLKHLLIGGEALPLQTVQGFFESFEHTPPKISNVYGPAECCVDCTCFDISRENLHELDAVPIGTPLGNEQVYIMDRDMNLQPIGISGELCIAGEGVGRGYLNQPELTAEKFCFLLNRFYRSYRSYIIYRTGDLARWLEDGNIEFLGRMDHQVKIRGLRIELGEIEQCLLACHHIKEAFVIATEDKYLCAYVVPASPGAFNVGDIRENLSRRLPDYMIPSFFVPLERIPLTVNGKIDRKALPSPGKIAGGEVYVPPQSVVEKKMAAIWSEILRIPVGEIGIDSDFFTLGGHSLKATSLVSRIHKEFDVKIPLAEIFRIPRVKELSIYIKENTRDIHVPIEPGEQKEYYPLSSSQKHLYVLHQMGLEDTAYNVPMTVVLEGLLNKKVLENTFRQSIERHESLRTSFHMIGDQPVQIVHDHVEFEIENYQVEEREQKTEDRRQKTGKKRETTDDRRQTTEVNAHTYLSSVIRHLSSEFTRPFDLSHSSLLRVGLIKEQEQKHILMVDMHHIITDGISINLFIREAMELYSGGKLSPLRLQYKDYAEWQVGDRQKKAIKRQEEYWMRQFAEEVPVLNLPLDYPRPKVQSFEGAVLSFELPRGLTRSINQMILDTGATLYMVLLAIYNILLSKLSGQEDIVVGTPIAARRHADLERIIGMFVNTLAPRNYPNSEKTAREFLEEIKESTLQAFENQEYQFEDLVEKVFVHRDTSRNPIFDTMFALQNMETQTDEIAADVFPLKISPYEIDYHTAKFDLTLTCFEEGGKLFCFFEYCTKLFKRDAIERFIIYFQQVLSAVLENPHQKIYQIEIITPEEKQRILYEFNDTAASYPNNKTLHQLFEEQEERIPDHVALIGQNSQQEGTRGLAPLSDLVSITYRELNNQSHRLACILTVKGVSADTIVGIMVERSIEMIVGIFGILETGGAYLPIDPGYPQDRIDYMLKDSGARILLKKSEIRNPKSETNPNDPNSNDQNKRAGVTVLDFEHLSFEFVSNFDIRASNFNSSNLAYIIYTSGTTGKPKGVMVEHPAVMNRLSWVRDKYRLNERDVILQATSFVFDVSVCEMFRWIPAGGRLCLLPPGGEKDPEQIIRTIARNGVTTADFIPAMLTQLLDYAKQQNLFKELAGLRWVWTGVEVVNVSLVKIFNETLHRLNQTRLINAYGPTESTVDVTYFDCSTVQDDDVVPIGRPMANVQIFILTGNDAVQPVGVYGQLCIAGKGLARGYLNNPGLTAEKFCLRRPGGSFRENRPLDPHKSFLINLPEGHHSPLTTHHSPLTIYLTGDLARWLPDGNIQFLGRIDYQVKIRGHRVELGEIENHLRRHPGVKDALVTVAETSAASGNKNLCAYITGKPGAGLLDIPGIKEYVSARLPGYMTPAYFCQLDEIPLTPGGKINRKALPLPGQQEPGAMYTPPGDELEKTLATLWAEVLEIDASVIGIDTDFFKCGGNSLNAVVLAARIHKELNVKVPMMVLFETPFIKGLARYIRGAVKEKHLAVEVVEEKEYYALSPAQERLYILQQMEPNATAYNMPVLMELEGYLDKEKLERVFVQLIRRHESFRTSFEMVAGNPVQKIRKNVEFKIRYYNLATEVTGVHSFVRPFDLESPPLLWVVLMKVEERKHLLAVDIHHIVTDGISTAIMVREFMALYEEKELSPLKLQYKDFARWQNDRMETGEMKKQEEYWTGIFQGLIPVLQLPYDYPRPALQSFAGNTIRFRLEAGETASLKSLAGKENVTFFIVLLSIYTLVLSRLSGQGDIVIGTPMAGRRHADLQGIMGMFVNTLALRSRPEENSTFTAFLKKVKEQTTAAFDNQEYPFERLVEKVAAARDTGRNPLFDVVFSLENMNIPALEIKGLKVSMADFGSGTAKFDLNLSAVESGDNLLGNLEYCTELFKEETVERFIVYFKEAVSAVVNGPNRAIAEIDIIPPGERDRLLFEFNDTGAEYPGDKTIQRLFEDQVERTPDHTAMVGPSDRSDMSDLSYISITYRKLNEQTGNLAGLLIEKGVQPDTIVGIMVERSVEMVVGILGILESGAAYLPIDPDSPRERIDYILKDSCASILLATEDIESRGDPLWSPCPGNSTIFLGGHGDPPLQSVSSSTLTLTSTCQVSPANLAYIIYTSGTTGHPKGTLVEHRSLVNLCYWHNRHYRVTGKDRATQYAALGFDASVWEIFPYLIKGVVIHILSAGLKLDIKRLAHYYRKNHITISFLPTQFCRQFMEEISDLPLLRILLTGGAKLDRFIRRPYRLYNNYGPTENTVVTTAYLVESYRDNIPIGKPVANVQVYILSKDTVRLQPIGVPGELCISGASMSRGYLNHPELTFEKFYLRPARGAGTHHSTTHHSPLTIYRTGDLARWLPDGNIEFIGRIDTQVKIRGFRIEPGEIESRLSQHENIKEAVVIDRTDSSGEKYLCAYVVYREPKDVKPTELKSYLSKTLPEYMIPARFVEIEKIPLNPNGKVDRNILPEPGARPGNEYVAPGTDKEREIAEIWKQVLGLEKVGIYDNFFDTGGNSLKIIKLTIELKKHLGIELPTAKMFQYTTIAAQARYIGGPDEKKSEEGDVDFDATKAKNKLKQRRDKTRR